MKAPLQKALIWTIIVSLSFSTSYQALVGKKDLRTYPAPGQRVDVGGHHLHIYCMGEGSPTVVMEAGMSGWSTDWVLVQPEIAKVTRVCSYDRAGYGWSDPGPQPRDSKQVAAELHTLLIQAGIDDQIVLVGHSLGGLFVQYYARTFPQQVIGVVLVDSVHPNQSQQMKEDVKNRYETQLRALTLTTKIIAPTGLLRLTNQPETIIANKLPVEYRSMVQALGFQSKAYRALDEEMASFEESQIEVQNAEPLPDILLAVISSTLLQDFPPGFSGEYMKSIWDKLQTDLGNSSTLPHMIALKSGHYIHIDQPELIIQTVTDMVTTIRAGSE